MSQNVFGRSTPGAEKYLNNRYALFVDDIQLGDYDKVDIPEMVWNDIEYRDSTGDSTKTSTTTTKQMVEIAFHKDMRVGNQEDMDELHDWFEAGSADKRSGSIVVYDKQNNEIRRWNFSDAYLIKFKPPDLEAGDGEGLNHVFTMKVSEIKRA